MERLLGRLKTLFQPHSVFTLDACKNLMDFVYVARCDLPGAFPAELLVDSLKLEADTRRSHRKKWKGK
jgi:hypothetical protein